MVGVINPNATESVLEQTELAKNSTFMLQPGEAWPSEQMDPFSTTSSSVPTSTPAAPTSTSAPAAATTTAAAATSSSHSSGLSGGGIAGVAIGAAAVALLGAALLFMCGRASRKHDAPPPGHVPVTYIDPKHMSVVTAPYYPDQRSSSFYARQSAAYASPALPGYVPAHDPGMSPPLAAVRPASTALNPAGTMSDLASPRSASPSDGNRSVGASAGYEHGDAQM